MLRRKTQHRQTVTRKQQSVGKTHTEPATEALAQRNENKGRDAKQHKKNKKYTIMQDRGHAARKKHASTKNGKHPKSQQTFDRDRRTGQTGKKG
ncbi:hypothetical protein [Gemmiger formicilis]|uniref:hypothetical protein n=1 Tax=Gemmiger formicilis TaxID=745368 RepID=UPI00099A7AE1|nr:hypothetical protein [Gemmiger formicilis]